MKEIKIEDIKLNPFTKISDEWMILAAGTKENGYNAMTCSWGHMGAIWQSGGGLPSVVVYVRPSRYTKEFVDREEFFTVSFFDKKYKKDMAYIGTHSGRDEDKIAKVGFTPVFTDESTYFEEADMVFICRKLYQAPIKEEGFVRQETVDECYPKRDFHEMYIGEIVKALVKE